MSGEHTVIAAQAICQSCGWKKAVLGSDLEVIKSDLQNEHQEQKPKCGGRLFLRAYQVTPNAMELYCDYLENKKEPALTSG